MFSSKFFESMIIPMPAMEADDITGEAQDGVRNAMNNSPTTQDGDRPEEDLTKVDGIFDNGPSGNANPNDQETPQDEEGNANDDPTAPGDTPTGEEEVPAEGEEGEGDENADPNLTGENDQEEESSEPEDPLLFAKKNRIRDNLVHIYNTFTGDIDTLTDSLNMIDHQPTVFVINSVIGHMNNAKEYTYKTLVEDITKLDYDELLQRYITLKRLYDVCIEMLQKHFDSCGDYFKKKTGHGNKNIWIGRPIVPHSSNIRSGVRRMREDDETKNLPGSAS